MSDRLIFETYSETDLKLLSLIQEDAIQSTTELASKLGVSLSTVRKRRAKLKSDGAIHKEVAILNPEKVGNFLYFMVDIKLAGDQSKAIEAIDEFTANSPMILQCFHTTGNSDLRMLIIARTSVEFENFLLDRFLSKFEISHYEANLVIRPVKMEFSLPLL